MADLGVGLIGAGFVSTLHAEAFAQVSGARVRAVASPTEAHAQQFAQQHHIERWHTDYHALLDNPEISIVCIGAPNYVHRDVVVDAAHAGKHVICEKPLARTLAEADEMIEACDRAGVRLCYAEELCFAPKYVRAKQLVDEGALGHVFHVYQGEQHDGPHSDWFWDVARSGGGVLMDMGCHAIEFFRWIYDKPRAIEVTAELGTYLHRDRTIGEDHAVGTVRFEGNRIGLIVTSWAKPGGMDDRAELIGTGGVTYVDLLRASALPTYSKSGFGYAVEKAPDTRGWSYPMFEEIWNYGFPQEMQHFTDCIRGERQPSETGSDGREVLEILYAMYRAAAGGDGTVGAGAREARHDPPVDPWLQAQGGFAVEVTE